MEHIKVLLIDDNVADVRFIREILTDTRWQRIGDLTFDVELVDLLSTGLERFAAGGVDVVLLDLNLPDSQGPNTLVRLGRHAPGVPIIVLTDVEDGGLGVQALKEGAQDYLVLDEMDGNMLVQAIRYAIERQQMCVALQTSEERFRNLIIRNADGVVVVGKNGVVRFVNPAAEALFGRTADDLVGEVFGFPMVTGEITELDIVCRDGEMAVAEMRVVVTEWDGDMAYVATLRDITQRKRTEETLRQREEQLQQAQKMEAIGRLAGGVVHDFNNLLTAIIGYSDIMLMRLDKDEPTYRFVEQISKAADRAALLTRQLLAFSRPQVVQPQLLNFNNVVAEMQNMLQPLIGEDIGVTTRLAPQLGQVQIDPGHIQQLLMNLIVNARDAMPQGGRLHIETANVELTEASSGRYLCAPPGPYVMLEVSDTGIGMDSEILPQLFEPFFTTKEMGKGTGLGLAVIYGILQQSGGDIEVHSEPGCGTTFRVYLCRVTEAEPALQDPDAPGGAPPGLETVLLVEDEEIVRVMIRDTLQINGYHVLEAVNAAEALQLCQQHAGPIHLLVADVIMPGMSGRELAERLVPLRPRMRVLFISGHPGDAVARHGVVYADTAFLQKPFTHDTLTHKVRQVLDMPPASARPDPDPSTSKPA